MLDHVEYYVECKSELIVYLFRNVSAIIAGARGKSKLEENIETEPLISIVRNDSKFEFASKDET